MQVLKGGLSAGRVEGMPQPPLLGCQWLYGLPTRPCLARRGTAHQDHDPAVPRLHRAHRIRQHAVMSAPDVPGQYPLSSCIGDVSGCDAGPVDLEAVRSPLPDGTPRRTPAHTPFTSLGGVNTSSCTGSSP